MLKNISFCCYLEQWVFIFTISGTVSQCENWLVISSDLSGWGMHTALCLSLISNKTFPVFDSVTEAVPSSQPKPFIWVVWNTSGNFQTLEKSTLSKTYIKLSRTWQMVQSVTVLNLWTWELLVFCLVLWTFTVLR